MFLYSVIFNYQSHCNCYFFLVPLSFICFCFQKRKNLFWLMFSKFRTWPLSLWTRAECRGYKSGRAAVCGRWDRGRPICISVSYGESCCLDLKTYLFCWRSVSLMCCTLVQNALTFHLFPFCFYFILRQSFTALLRPGLKPSSCLSMSSSWLI